MFESLTTIRHTFQAAIQIRRIKTEEKAKVVKDISQFLAPLAVLPRSILKNRMNSFFCLNHPGEIHHVIQIVLGKTASAARNLINSSPQTEATTFAFSSDFTLLLCSYLTKMRLFF